MDIDPVETQPCKPAAPPAKKTKAPSSNHSSTAPSPKPKTKEKDLAPPPLPGSGLVSSSLFGDTSNKEKGDSVNAPDIILEIPLVSGTSNKVINFAQLAEEKYGFAALYPRLALQKDRMKRIAAATAALEREKKANGIGKDKDSASSGESDSSDSDSDDPMNSGIHSDTNRTPVPAEDEGPKKKGRRRRNEDYDRDDPFVDDSEMIWTEQAAASSDGFFVYSGPLVPEGEKVAVTRFVFHFHSFLSSHPLHQRTNVLNSTEPTAP